MKSLKKLVGLVALTGLLGLTGCGNPVTTKISPVEDSGERVECTAVSASLPKDWTKATAPAQYDAIALQKGFLNSEQVIVMDVPGAGDQSLEDNIDSMKANIEATGAKVATAEVRDYTFGKGIFFQASGEITQELIDTNIAAGLCTEQQAKVLKGLVGKNKNEAVVYFFAGDKIICVDGLTLGDDADGIVEATEFLANSLQEK